MYAEIVELTRNHEAEITLAAARIIKTAGINWYSQLEVAELAQRIIPSFELRLRYLETNDLTEWRAYLNQLTVERDNQGVDFQSILKAGECIGKAMSAFFEKQIPLLGPIDGIPADVVLANLERRMAGLTMVGSAVVANASLKQKIK